MFIIGGGRDKLVLSVSEVSAPMAGRGIVFMCVIGPYRHIPKTRLHLTLTQGNYSYSLKGYRYELCAL